MRDARPSGDPRRHLADRAQTDGPGCGTWRKRHQTDAGSRGARTAIGHRLGAENGATSTSDKRERRVAKNDPTVQATERDVGAQRSNRARVAQAHWEPRRAKRRALRRDAGREKRGKKKARRRGSLLQSPAGYRGAWVTGRRDLDQIAARGKVLLPPRAKVAFSALGSSGVVARRRRSRWGVGRTRDLGARERIHDAKARLAPNAAGLDASSGVVNVVADENAIARAMRGASL